MEYPDGCNTAIRYVARKVAAMKDRLVWFEGGFTAGTLFLDGWTCIWQLMTEFESCLLSEYLIGTWLVGFDSSKLNKSDCH